MHVTATATANSDDSCVATYIAMIGHVTATYLLLHSDMMKVRQHRLIVRVLGYSNAGRYRDDDDDDDDDMTMIDVISSASYS